MSRRVLILGAAGRDFHNFNCCYRNDPGVSVVAFTAAQIPGIDGRRYPASLAGPLYPAGIPIYPEARLEELIREFHVDEVILAYSDLSARDAIALASRALASGADFRLLGLNRTQLRSRLPVIAVCALRTGSGKSQTARRVVQILREAGVRAAVLRHPMPYGDLESQRLQRFGSFSDLAGCTLEEREEYEPHIRMGTPVFAGVDYEEILRAAEDEAEVLVWDGGNNDVPFLVTDLWITVVDVLREDPCGSYPGEVNLLRADLFVLNKVTGTAPPALCARLRQLNARARLIEARSRFHFEGEASCEGKRVIVVEDGPSVTHGGLPYGAGYVAAQQLHAGEIVDPRPFAVGSLARAFADHPHLGPVLPALGYSPEQREELRRSILAARPEVVIAGTPIDLARDLGLAVPVLRVRYELDERGHELRDSVLHAARFSDRTVEMRTLKQAQQRG